jgi:hypothetical protein
VDGVYDLGGLQGFGPVVSTDGEQSHHHAWELRAQAIAMMVGGGSVRPWIERIAPPTYLAASYYERWLIAAEHAVTERAVVTADELGTRCNVLAGGEDVGAPAPRLDDEALRADMERYMTHVHPMPVADDAAFAVGAVVRVLPARAAERNRCPRYVRGVVGRVERVCGRDRLPSSTELETLYTVEFSSADVWGASSEPPFAVLVDLFEHHLEAERPA